MESTSSELNMEDSRDNPLLDEAMLEVLFAEAEEIVGDLEKALLDGEAGAGNGRQVHRAFRAVHTLKGNAGSAGLDDVAALAHAVESVLGRLRDATLAPGSTVTDALLAASDALRGMLAARRAGRPPAPASRALAERLEDLGAAPTTTPPAAEVSAGPAPREDRLEATSLRVATEKVDRLVDLAGELAVAQSMVGQLVASFTPDRLTLLQEAVAELERSSRELQQRVMSIRMLPLSHALDRLPRLVRDLAARTGKHVALSIDGEGTELDKSMIERIGDPLVHLVRNAVDHGIESPDVRRAAGKPECGSVSIRATRCGSSVVVEVRDDGAGLDRERILARAVAVGLLPAGERPDDPELCGLILAPGLSTADTITDVSGRGVGMDVVKSHIEMLGGQISIDSTPGHGTCFRLQLPLTLATIDGQLLRVGAQVFVVPLVSIVESLRPAAGQVVTILGRGEALRLREEVLPILRLHGLLGVEPDHGDPTRALLVVVEGERGRAALLVDGLLGQHQIVIKSLEPNLRRVEGVSGATILGDGRVALILDVDGLEALGARARRRRAGFSPPSPPVTTDVGGEPPRWEAEASPGL